MAQKQRSTFEMEFWKKLCVREARERSSPPNIESSRTCALKMKKSLPFSNTGTTYGAMESFPNGFDQLYFDSHLFENRIFRLDVFGTAVRTTYQTQNLCDISGLSLSLE